MTGLTSDSIRAKMIEDLHVRGDEASKYAAIEIQYLQDRLKDAMAEIRKLQRELIDFKEPQTPTPVSHVVGIEWTPDLEAARVRLCEFWLEIADDPSEGGARYPQLGAKAMETEQALTLLGEIARGVK